MSYFIYNFQVVMIRQLNFIYLIQSVIKYLSTSRKQIIIRGKNDPDVKKKRRIRIKNIKKTRGLSLERWKDLTTLIQRPLTLR